MIIRMIRKSTLIIGPLILCVLFIPLINTTQLENQIPSENTKSIPEQTSELSSDEIILGYTSNMNSTITPVSEGAIIEGDHVVLTASAPSISDIANCTMSISSGFLFQDSKDLVIPTPMYDPFAGVIDSNQFSWIIVSGFRQGDIIEYEMSHSTVYCELMAWWTDSFNSTWTFFNNILFANSGLPSGTVIADEAGSIAFGCYNLDEIPGIWNLTVDTRTDELYSFSVESEVSIDTYEFMQNNTFFVDIEFCTLSNEVFNRSLSLTVNNLFSPCIDYLDITGSGAVKTVEWIYSDLNINDEHAFEVHLSSDGGLSFQLLARGLTTPSYDWDSSGWMILDYVIQVRIFDNDPLMNPTGLETGSYWPGLSDCSNSDTFEAGTVPSVITYSPQTWDTWPYSTEPSFPTTSETFSSISSSSSSSSTSSSTTTRPTSRPSSTTPPTTTLPKNGTDVSVVLSTIITTGSIAVIVVFSLLILINRYSFSHDRNS